jgi:hypothetical protein
MLAKPCSRKLVPETCATDAVPLAYLCGRPIIGGTNVRGYAFPSLVITHKLYTHFGNT